MPSTPAGIKPVDGFDINQYLGCWYEVARLDNQFQRGLEQITAVYSLSKDDSVRVENTGWSSKKKQKKTVIGKAKLVSDKQIGHLKVSWGGPFYSSYVVFYLEADYSVAMVCGSNRQYCWILAREPAMLVEDLAKYQDIARAHGFGVENFIYTSTCASPYQVVDR
jgi:apolipoprotein D and lipocalin family protein